MSISRLLVANRAEIALRVLDAAAAVGVASVAVHAADESSGARHVERADEAHRLPGSGPAAYLDADALLEVAARGRCDAVHPGYGFLAENAGFARRCVDAGLVWVGPDPAALELFGDKVRARAHARRLGVPVPAGTPGAVDLAGARAFAGSHGGPVMIKAVGGGGGRGMRVVAAGDDLAAAWERCRSEAVAAFGNGGLYVEELRAGARHVEVQLVGDDTAVLALGDRDCSVQRRNQKLVELAPAPGLPAGVRAALHDAAVRLTGGLRGVATAEFLVDGDGPVFLEVNPRIQVEHTVTEEVTGVDLWWPSCASRPGRRSARSGWPSPRRRAEPHCRYGSTRRRSAPTAVSDRARARSPVSSRRRGAGSGSTPTPIPDTSSIRATTRCWPSSSSPAPTCPPPRHGRRGHWTRSRSRAWRPTAACSPPC
jgi:acetyl/propionyl-CoA carboxylase alpha subunit